MTAADSRGDSDTKGTGRDLIFASYSHDDAHWVHRIALLLKPVIATGQLALWVDNNMRAGTAWREQIDDAIARSQAALVVVSANYLGSEFVMSQELPALKARGVRLMPLLVGDCLWRRVPQLSSVQWLHDPGRDGPLDAISRPGRRTQRLREICERLLDNVQLDTDPVASNFSVVSQRHTHRQFRELAEAMPGAKVGRLIDVPELPPGYLSRDELDGLIATVADTKGDGTVGIVGDSAAIGLHGQGGIGKTVLAIALARDVRTRKRFPDGVYWVTVGERPDLLGIQLTLLRTLGARGGSSPRSSTEAADRLREILDRKRILLVVDDVWSTDAATAFRVVGPHGRVVYTSRNSSVISAIGADSYKVDVLSISQARALISAVLGGEASDLPEVVDGIIAKIGSVALAVALIAAAVRGGRDWAQVSTDLDEGASVFGHHPYANTFKAMQASVQALPAELADALLDLAVFPSDMRIPFEAVIRYWGHHRQYGDHDSKERIAQLSNAGVLSTGDGYIEFHDLQFDYILLYAPPLERLHEVLIDAYRRDSLPGHQNEWWRATPNEPYISDHLAFHLRGSGRYAELVETVTDPAYLTRRLECGGAYSAESDLAQASAADPASREVSWWTEWISRHAHLLAPGSASASSSPNSGWLAPTVAAWLDADATHYPNRMRVGRLELLRRSSYPRLRWGLTPPPANLARVLPGRVSSISAVAWSPDDTLILGGGADGWIQVWDIRNGKRVFEANAGDGNSVRSLAWSPSGAHVACSTISSVSIREAQTGQEVFAAHIVYRESRIGPSPRPTGAPLRRTVPGEEFRSIAWSRDGSQIYVSGPRGWELAWDAIRGAVMPALILTEPDIREDAATGLVPLWDTNACTSERLIDATGRSGTLHMTHSSSSLTVEADDADGALHVCDARTMRSLVTLEKQTPMVQVIAWSRRNEYLAGGWARGWAVVWDATTGEKVHNLAAYGGSVRSVAWAAHGPRLATGGNDGLVRIWQSSTPVQVSKVKVALDRSTRCVAWSPDCSFVAAGGDDGLVKIWDSTTGVTALILRGRGSTIRSVAWSPDGTHVMASGIGGWVRTWNRRTGKIHHDLDVHTGTTMFAAWLNSERLILSASESGAIRISEHPGGLGFPFLGIRRARIFGGNYGTMRSADISLHQWQLASGYDDGTVRLWDFRTGQLVRKKVAHRGAVQSIKFDQRGERLITSGDDGEVRVWNPHSGKLLGSLGIPGVAVRSVDWSPDGRFIASATADGRLSVWTASNGCL